MWLWLGIAGSQRFTVQVTELGTPGRRKTPPAGLPTKGQLLRRKLWLSALTALLLFIALKNPPIPGRGNSASERKVEAVRVDHLDAR